MAISSRDPFPHSPPYELLYAERVPLLYIFRNAIEDLGYGRIEGSRWDIAKAKMRQILPYSKKFLSAECGVYLGNSLIACSKIARDYFAPVHLYGLDTFSGLPELSGFDIKYSSEKALYRNQENKLFSDTSLDIVKQAVEKEGLSQYITLVQGLFANTLATLPNNRRFFFVNIDCDLYEPHLECLEYFYPRMEKGGIVFFDDYHSIEFPMAREAIDKFMKGRSENLFHLSYGPSRPNFTKAFFVKD